MQKRIIGGTVLVIIVLFGALFFLSTRSSAPSSQYTTTQQAAPVTQEAVSAQITKVPVVSRTVRGTVVALASGSASIKTSQGQTQQLRFAPSVEVFRIISGTLEQGDAQTGPGVISDLKVGQTVSLIVDTDSSQIQQVVIVK